MTHAAPTPEATSSTPVPILDASTAQDLRGEAPASQPAAPASGFTMDPAKREELIRRAAYMLYERRGYVDGYHDEDWLRAEVLIDRVLLGMLSREIFASESQAPETGE